MAIVIGIGTDLVDIDRFRSVILRTPGVIDRAFTAGERAYADRARDPAERLAVRFAAKEAVLKALGAGIFELPLRDIEIVRAESGAPEVRLHGRAASAAAERGVGEWKLTMTHTAHNAQAVAVAL